MAFKFLTLLNLLAIGLVAAGDYEYNNPRPQTVDSTTINNSVQDINSFSGATAPENSEATPVGYDYTPQAPKNAENDVYIEQQQFRHDAPGVYWPPAKYDFSYGVNDEYTGDIKSHAESSDGYQVRGSYSLIDPDGFERVVTYTADDINGFNAVVSRKPVATGILKSTAVVELHQQQPQDSYSTTGNIEKPLQNEGPVQPHDSYATPPSEHNINGPYP